MKGWYTRIDRVQGPNTTNERDATQSSLLPGRSLKQHTTAIKKEEKKSLAECVELKFRGRLGVSGTDERVQQPRVGPLVGWFGWSPAIIEALLRTNRERGNLQRKPSHFGDIGVENGVCNVVFVAGRRCVVPFQASSS